MRLWRARGWFLFLTRAGAWLQVYRRAAPSAPWALSQTLAPPMAGAAPVSLCWAPREASDGADCLAAVGADGSVTVYASQARGGAVSLAAVLRDRQAAVAAFAPHGGVLGLALAVGARDGGVLVYTAESGEAGDWLLQAELEGAAPGGGPAAALAWSAGTARAPALIVGGAGGATVWALCVALNRWNAVANLQCGGGGATAVAWAENIRRRSAETLAVASADGVRVYEVEGAVAAVALDAGEVEACDAPHLGAPVLLAPTAEAASSLEFDALGAQLAAGLPSGEVRLFAVNALGEWADYAIATGLQ